MNTRSSSHSLAVPLSVRAVSLLLVVAVLVLASGALAAPKVVGIAAAIINQVEIKGAAASQYHKARLRQRVALADAVRTGDYSRLQLLLLDKTKFTVGANAELTIDKFVYDPNGGGSFSATVSKGAFRFMSGRSKGSKDSSIKSPAATIGIRGTLLDGVIGPKAIAIALRERAVGRDVDSDPLSATLVVLRGPGPDTQGGLAEGNVTVSAAGSTVELTKPLMAAYVPRTGATPIGPFAISSPGLAELNDLLIEGQEPLSQSNSATTLPFPDDDRPEWPVYVPRHYPGVERGTEPGGRGGFPGVPGFPGIPNIPDMDDTGSTPTPDPEPPTDPEPTTRPEAKPDPIPAPTEPSPTTTAPTDVVEDKATLERQPAPNPKLQRIPNNSQELMQ